jgi:hypothetical protein
MKIRTDLKAGNFFEDAVNQANKVFGSVSNFTGNATGAATSLVSDASTAANNLTGQAARTWACLVRR